MGYQALKDREDDELLRDSNAISNAPRSHYPDDTSAFRDSGNDGAVFATFTEQDVEIGTSAIIDPGLNFPSIMSMLWSSTALISGKQLSMIRYA